jgi:hypothetical protein
MYYQKFQNTQAINCVRKGESPAKQWFYENFQRDESRPGDRVMGGGIRGYGCAAVIV